MADNSKGTRPAPPAATTPADQPAADKPKGPKRGALTADPSLQAMAKADALLAEIDESVRQRVLWFLNDKYGEKAPIDRAADVDLLKTH
jgi:hypothetical protein